jgi:hypothetical protein
MRTLTFMVALAFCPTEPALADSQGRVHSEPGASCRGFKPHHLCFDLPADAVARAEYSSEPFYAVILKTTARCAFSERERLDVQALFPRSKVFAESFQCNDDVEESIRYTNVNDKFGFLAVHAGATLKEANERLAQAKATGRFPGANMRRMQAVFVFP